MIYIDICGLELNHITVFITRIKENRAGFHHMVAEKDYSLHVVSSSIKGLEHTALDIRDGCNAKTHLH